MSPQKQRPQARKGRTAVAARKSRRKSDRTLSFVAVAVLVVGVLLVIVLKPSSSASGLQLGDHWHVALGVYACDHWEGDASWPTPVNPATKAPVLANSNTYNGLHSHADGLIHMEPQTSADTGENATLGNYFSHNGFELSPTSVRFGAVDLKNGDKCGAEKATLHWLVNGKERIGDPTKYLLKENDWIAVAFLPDSKKITSLGQPPSVKNLPGASGRETPGDATPTSSTPPSVSTAPSPSTAPAPSTAPSTPTST